MSEHRTYFYARVSSKDQNEERQLNQFEEVFGIDRDADRDRIVIDKESGKDFNRMGYQHMKNQLLRSGDTLVVISLDRLGRNKQAIKEELEYFRANNIRVKIMDLPTTMQEYEDNTTAAAIMDMVNNILIEVMGTMAEQERDNIKKRQRQGIDNARDKGVKMGRPKSERPENWAEVTAEWTAKKISAVEAMKRTGLKKNTFYTLALEDGLYESKSKKK